MRGLITPAVAGAGVVLTLAFPAGAAAETRWVCTVDGTRVVFVTAADAALHGISQANSKAGRVFEEQFGEEDCHVEHP